MSKCAQGPHFLLWLLEVLEVKINIWKVYIIKYLHTLLKSLFTSSTSSKKINHAL